MNVAIVTPVYSTYSATYISSIFKTFLTPIDKINFRLISPIGGSNITAFRNNCIQSVYETEEKEKIKFDLILWIDADIKFKIEDIKRLISHKKDVVCGVYFGKAKPFKPMVGYYDLKRLANGFPSITKQELLSKKLIEIDWAGLGFCLMKKEILDKMKDNYPWFEMFVIDLLKPMQMSGGINIKKELLSEDITYFTKIKALGYKIYADTSILLGHEGQTTFNIEHYKALN